VDLGPTRQIYRVDLEGNRAVLRAGLLRYDLENLWVHYGHGTAPVCNITDQADQSLPVFGPAPLAVPRAVTDYVRRVRVSRLLPAPQAFAALRCPTASRALEMRERAFPTHHLNVGPDFLTRRGEDVLVYYACDLFCREPMCLLLRFGYDGPTKLWIDGRELYSDPQGTNPATPYDAAIRCKASRGLRRIWVALLSNGGRATGIFLRAERQDVPAALRKKGRAFYALPTFG
jgi:hypothetical protein